MLIFCCWPNCPSTNISSELLHQVKSITAVLTVVPYACGSLIKVFELRFESRENRQIQAGMRTWLTFTVIPNWFNKRKSFLAWLSFILKGLSVLLKRRKKTDNSFPSNEVFWLRLLFSNELSHGNLKSISTTIRLPANAPVKSHKRPVANLFCWAATKDCF